MIYLAILGVFVTITVIDMWLEFRFQCDCGREHTWYYTKNHTRAGVMLGRAIWNTTAMIIALIAVLWIAAPILALMATYTWRVWWFHEKDKMKRKAAKLTGVVGFNDHGRLVVKAVKA